MKKVTKGRKNKVLIPGKRILKEASMADKSAPIVVKLAKINKKVAAIATGLPKVSLMTEPKPFFLTSPILAQIAWTTTKKNVDKGTKNNWAKPVVAPTTL